MQRTRRTFLVALPTAAMLTLIVTAATSPFPSNTVATEFRQGRVWADAHRDSLPASLEQISTLPLGYRKAVLTLPAVSIERRELLWRSHLESFIKPAAQLTPTQRHIKEGAGELTPAQAAFIRQILDSLHSGLGAAADTSGRKAFATRVCTASKALFSRTVAVKIFATLGPSAPALTRPANASLVAGFAAGIREITIKFGLRKPILPDCACNINSICSCPDDTYCVYENCYMHPGCGCFWMFDCDGSTCYEASTKH